MDPISIAMLAGNVAQTGFGIYQGVKANKMAKGLQTPEYEIPPEIYKNLDQATIMMLEGLPAEQKQAYLDNIGRTQQAAFANIDRRKGGPGFTSTVQQGLDSQKDLFAKDVAQRQANIGVYMDQNQNLANYKDKVFADERKRYEEKAASIEALTGASIENIFGGVQQGISQYADYKMYQDLLGANKVDQPPGLPKVDLGVEMTELGTPKLDNPYVEKGLTYGSNVYDKGVYDFSKGATDNKYNFYTGK